MNIPFSLTQLEYALAVQEHRHFGRAARACHVSQPTLSMQLQKLEEQIGLTLFDRSKQPVLPTTEGASFLHEARAVLRAARKLGNRESPRDTTPSGEFRLAVIPSLSPYLIPLFLQPFLNAYPRVQLKLQELTTEAILAALQEDRIDAGLLATPLGQTGLTETPLFYEEFLLFASQDHPILAAKDIALELERNPPPDLWLLTDGHCFKDQVLAVCHRDANIQSPVEFEAGSLEVLIRLIRGGRGYTLLPRLALSSLTPQEIKTQVRSLRARPPVREVGLVTHRQEKPARVLQALIQMIDAAVPAEFPRKKARDIRVVPVKL